MFVAAYPSWPMISIMNHGISLKRSIKRIPTHQNVLDRTLLMNAGYSGFPKCEGACRFCFLALRIVCRVDYSFFFPS